MPSVEAPEADEVLESLEAAPEASEVKPPDEEHAVAYGSQPGTDKHQFHLVKPLVSPSDLGEIQEGRIPYRRQNIKKGFIIRQFVLDYVHTRDENVKTAEMNTLMSKGSL